MPVGRWKAKYWMDMQEAFKTRKNGRVCDRIMVCLLKELTAFERIALVRDFMNVLTEQKVPYYFAIHDKGKDANNPHCHIVIRDNCPNTGKKVLKLSSGYSTYRLHELWRASLAKWGFITKPVSKEEKQKYKRKKPKAHYYGKTKKPIQQHAKQPFNFMAP